MSVHTLNAWVERRRLGVLTYDDEMGRFAFVYDPAWVSRQDAFAISPALPFTRPEGQSDELHSVSVRRFFENLLPEGKALEDAAGVNQVSKANLYGLLRSLGRESTGALSLLAEPLEPATAPNSQREIGLDELSRRINDRASQPFNVWDGRVRMSIAGLQDKLAVYADDTNRFYLVEGDLASTHILKPEPMNPALGQLVANEHFCLNLAMRLGMSTARAEILRVPEPVLVVKRFDRRPANAHVQRLHCIDACQALNLGVDYKYERNFGNGRDVAHIRDGVSLERLFSLAPRTQAEAVTRMELLRWTLVQYLLGNSDAHGKNVSFMVEPGGMRLAPHYDLVSVCIYPGLEHEAAMAIGDEFDFEKVRAYDWAEFSERCGIQRRLFAREARRITKALRSAAPVQLEWAGYTENERELLRRVVDYCLQQAERLDEAAGQISAVSLD